jgi:hypothetical protein
MRAIAFCLALLLATNATAQDAASSAAAEPAVAPADAAQAPAPADATNADAPDPDATGKGGALLASRRNYLDPAERDVPIVCKDGDFERHAGRSLGQVFGADWPVSPVPTSSVTRARTLEPGRMVWPRGMEGKTGLVVVAVLVDASGKPLRAEPLCANTTGFDMAARRASMDATYSPAAVDGTPVVSPVVRVIRFLPPRRKASSRRSGASTD